MRPGHAGSLFALPIQVGTLLANWLAASALAQILALNVVACVAVGVVVINRLLHRVPRVFRRHFHALLYNAPDRRSSSSSPRMSQVLIRFYS